MVRQSYHKSGSQIVSGLRHYGIGGAGEIRTPNTQFRNWPVSLYLVESLSPSFSLFRYLSPLFSALICTAICTVFLCAPAIAQEKPEAPKPKTDRKVFLAGVSLLAASKAADAISTRQVLDLPDARGSELNPLFGPHPSPAKQAGINLGIFAAQSTAFYFTERSRHAWIRWTGRALMAHEIEEHVRFAACNAGIDTHSKVTQNRGRVIPF